MKPIYTIENTKAAYQLNWGLTIFWRNQPINENIWIDELTKITEADGVRILKHRFLSGNASQFFISTKPLVSPSQMIRSIKGRLQYLIRKSDPKAFQRNYGVRSIGSATRETVETYVKNQLDHHTMADIDVQKRLEKFQKHYQNVDLISPMTSAHGQYWYNLHFTIVNGQRWNQVSNRILNQLVTMFEKTARKYNHRMSRLSVLTDHIHWIIGCPVDQAPSEIAISYLNNAAFVYEMKPVFQFGYFSGTIGEYDRGAVK